MCGVAGIVGEPRPEGLIEAMLGCQGHRGPDDRGIYQSEDRLALLGHNRLSILDTSSAGHQPMSDPSGRYWLVFNGEIYNYLELRRELKGSYGREFVTGSDSEVLLAAWDCWGPTCLDRLIGMFAFAIWDRERRSLFLARDRFGVKPLYLHQTGRHQTGGHQTGGALLFASEIKALHQAGVSAEPDPEAWSSWLSHGIYESDERCFWRHIRPLPPGHCATFEQLPGSTDFALRVQCWWDLAQSSGVEFDQRGDEEVMSEVLELLEQSVDYRFRSDVPLGLNLSGGLDSSALLALVQRVHGDHSDVRVMTFSTGDPDYDETPWVQQMLAQTAHPLLEARLRPDDVPELALSLQRIQDEPFGGLPNLAYARLFEVARDAGLIVLLDGQGLDEQWAGYDYYRKADAGFTVQGSSTSSLRPDCLSEDFRRLATTLPVARPFADELRNRQYMDARFSKLPRALRFNDRASMRSSTELREPFLDHRLFELALRQPAERKIGSDGGKVLLRRIVAPMLPQGLAMAPKRPVQTPQREWLRGPLRGWANEMLEVALTSFAADWFDRPAVERAWHDFMSGRGDNAHWTWQWINIGLAELTRPASTRHSEMAHV
jgi:asparagine synthase (glutamine-hydrolysing)